MSFINWGSETPEQLAIRRRLEDQALYEQAIRAMQARAGQAPGAVGGGAGVVLESTGGFVPPSPAPGTSLYYIRLLDGNAGNAIMFNGFFYVDDSTHIVQTFYDLTNPTVNIRSTGGNGGPSYLYYPGWLCFDEGGCNVTSFPYLYGVTQGDYNLYGITSSSNGLVDGHSNINYAFSLTPII